MGRVPSGSLPDGSELSCGDPRHCHAKQAVHQEARKADYVVEQQLQRPEALSTSSGMKECEADEQRPRPATTAQGRRRTSVVES